MIFNNCFALTIISHLIFDFHVYFSNMFLHQNNQYTYDSKDIFKKSRFCQINVFVKQIICMQNSEFEAHKTYFRSIQNEFEKKIM